MAKQRETVEEIAGDAMVIGVVLKVVAVAVSLMGVFVSDPDWKRFDFLFALVAYIGSSILTLSARRMRAAERADNGEAA